jgi:cell division cycle protein 37
MRPPRSAVAVLPLTWSRWSFIVFQAVCTTFSFQLRNEAANMASSITTEKHQASTLFRNDVNETYAKIKSRATELSKDPSASNDPAGVEQIQLHAVEPNTKITINIPPEGSTDPEVLEARKIFESFSPELQKSLLSESLDEVNKVLGKMPVEEAEEVVDKLGQGGLLSLEEGIVDATTEEGKKKLEEIEAEGKKENLVEEVGEPGGDVAELD